MGDVPSQEGDGVGQIGMTEQMIDFSPIQGIVSRCPYKKAQVGSGYLKGF